MKKNIKVILTSLMVGVCIGAAITFFISRLYSKEKSKAIYAKGMEEYSINNYDKAISYFCMSIGLKPEFYELYQALAKSYEKIGEYDLALEAYRSASRLNTGRDNVEKMDKAFIAKQIKIIENREIEE